MNYIGNIIHEFRNILPLTRKELCAGICSEKYLYMIEKGIRTPSTEVTRLLSDRLGVDIFKYYEYLGCAEPIKVCNFIERFYRHRMESNFDAVLEDTEKASQLKDFRKIPWLYEIKVNQLMLRVLSENDYLQTIPILIDTIAEIQQKRANRNVLAGLYVLLSTCYQMDRDMVNAKKAVALAYEWVSGRQGMAKYIQISSAIRLNKITIHYLSEDFDEVIKNALALIEYEDELHFKGYSDQAAFYLAFSYFQSGQEKQGILWFHKALCTVLVNHNPINMRYLAGYEVFSVMLQDKRISEDLVEKFQRISY